VEAKAAVCHCVFWRPWPACLGRWVKVHHLRKHRSPGQSAPRNLAAKAAVVELTVNSSQAAFDVAKTFPIDQLGESHAQVLVVACKRANPVVSLIPGNPSAELVHGACQ
jgi:hypothetical protein